MNDSVKLSIVLEWDNVLLSEMSRCDRMLDQLMGQIDQVLSRPQTNSPPSSSNRERVEIVVVYDQDQASDNPPERKLRNATSRLDAPVDLSFFAAREATYYELKNIAAKKTTGKIVVLIDSDVIPEPNWLPSLLDSLADPRVAVIGGSSYIDPYSLYAKSFALGWFFPLRKTRGTLHEANVFYANNVAFRGEIIRRYPFPALPGACRGAAELLAKQLQADGIKIFRNPRAQVSHPPPFPRNFIRRGIAQGRDHLIQLRHHAGNGEVEIRRSWNDVRVRAERARRRIRKMHSRVDLHRSEIPIAIAIMTAYFSLFLAGDLMMRIAPTSMRKRFRI